MTTSIQFPGNPSPFSGTFSANVVDDNGNPSNVLDGSQDFRIECEWTYNALNILFGNWHVRAYASDLSSGNDVDLPEALPVQASQPDGTAASPKKATVTVPAHTLTAGGPYRLVTVLTHESGGVATPIAAIDEGPLVTIVDA